MDAAACRLHAEPMTEEDFQATRITVRLGAIAANYRTYRRMVGPASVAAVVKADAYGLGAARIAPMLAGVGCDSFFVARLEEGIRLRKLLPDARIFVLDGAQPDAVPALLTHRLTPALNSLAEIAAWSAAAGATRTSLDAVLHVDTGINRLGLPGDELAILSGEARVRLAGLNIVLVMSHLACGDDAASKMNAEQLSRFQQALAMLPAAPASLAASHGAMLGPEYHFDLVRPGIGLYGANPQANGQNLMQATFALTGKLLQLRRIDSGASVGYAATFRAKRPTMLATVALGYADGIPRTASNQGFAAIHGVRAPITGRVSMDVLVLDVTDMAEPPRVGDDVELIGDTVTLRDAAKAAGTNEYEILTRLGHRLPRVYVEGASA
ncbi:MAG: Alanine racemase [Alphaproteobacteria bacterium]|nr:Alanine racemase [Alphaproteobacteria bacterium]MDB5739749.1 Alanine racemase [Alphaproteobacteria bacterium]